METHVFDTMGTVASIRCVGGMPRREVLDAVEGTFEALEAWFSLYRPESEISRIARGDLSLTASSGLFRDTYARALEWRSLTNDAFTPHRPDGVIDLSGIVKADAMDAAGRVLEAAGIDDWLLNVGGDVLAHGAFGGASWQVGVADPDDRTRLLCAVALESPRQALATSGVAERGEHIWRSDRQRSDDRRRYRQASVLAVDIITADVLATAIIAGGESVRDALLDSYGEAIDVVTVDAAAHVEATPRLTDVAGFERGLAGLAQARNRRNGHSGADED